MSLAIGAYFFLIAFFLAHLEIQIEGPHGWAEKLPTWSPPHQPHFNPSFRWVASRQGYASSTRQRYGLSHSCRDLTHNLASSSVSALTDWAP